MLIHGIIKLYFLCHVFGLLQQLVGAFGFDKSVFEDDQMYLQEAVELLLKDKVDLQPPPRLLTKRAFNLSDIADKLAKWNLRTVEEPNLKRRILNAEEIDHLKNAVLLTSALYCPHTLQNWTCAKYCEDERKDVTIEAIIQDKIHDGLAYIGAWHSRRILFIGFRGVATWTALLRGMQVYTIPLREVIPDAPSSAAVHAGFLYQYESLGPKVLENMVKVLPKYQDWQIQVAGHSLGGFHSVLFGLQLISELKIPVTRIKIYTVGQPKSGNKEYADYVNNIGLDIYRVVNQNDIGMLTFDNLDVSQLRNSFLTVISSLSFPVPHLPPHNFGFYHYDTEIFVTENQTTLLCNISNPPVVSGSDPECSRKYTPLNLSVLPHFGLFNLIKLTIKQDCDTRPNTTTTLLPTPTPTSGTSIVTATPVKEEELRNIYAPYSRTHRYHYRNM
ncbi:Alpha/Beta hydrolase protein [Paraphysoderma sedebokerense]|nr:Alpha/Beta hydrolase protein [Paraphysoderma sedebokerense]